MDNGGRRVLLVAHELSRTGAPLMLHKLAAALARRGHDVTVLSPDEGELSPCFERLGVPVVTTPLALGGGGEVAAFARGFELVVANTVLCWKFVRSLGASVNCVWWIHEAGIVDELAEAETGFPPVVEAAAKIIVPSAFAAGYVAKYRGGKPVEALRCGVDDPRPAKARTGGGDGKLRFGVVGTIHPAKGQDIALAAFKLLDGSLLSKATLALVGKIADPAFFRELYFLAESLGDFEVCLRPPVDAENSGLDAIDETDVIIVPSRNESFGLVALEAMMLSKVCVVSASAGVSEIIRDGHDGLVFPACDPVALSGLLGGIISGGFDLGLIGRNARETYLDGFTLERFERAMLRACGLPEAPG